MCRDLSLGRNPKWFVLRMDSSWLLSQSTTKCLALDQFEPVWLEPRPRVGMEHSSRPSPRGSKEQWSPAAAPCAAQSGMVTTKFQSESPTINK